MIIDATEEDDSAKKLDASSCPVTLSDDQVVNVTMDIFLAGYHTTASTLSFISYLLALHPDIQEKLQAEIHDFYQQNPVSYINNPRDLVLVLCVF